MTIILIILLVIVSVIALVILIQRDMKGIEMQAVENPYDCNNGVHRFEAQYDEEYTPISQGMIMQIGDSCEANQSDFEKALLISSRISRKYRCHVCSICGKTINKGQADGPA
jgi:hypothetical protein